MSYPICFIIFVRSKSQSSFCNRSTTCQHECGIQTMIPNKLLQTLLDLLARPQSHWIYRHSSLFLEFILYRFYVRNAKEIQRVNLFNIKTLLHSPCVLQLIWMSYSILLHSLPPILTFLINVSTKRTNLGEI